MPTTTAVDIRSSITSSLKEIDRDLAGLAQSQTGFLRQIADYVLCGEGKRMRPALVYLTSSLGKSPLVAVHSVAMAVELIHIATPTR